MLVWLLKWPKAMSDSGIALAILVMIVAVVFILLFLFEAAVKASYVKPNRAIGKK